MLTFASCCLALPAKPLNSVSLADADRENSMAYVLGKLGSAGASLQDGDRAEVEKIGGRMADLELVSNNIMDHPE